MSLPDRIRHFFRRSLPDRPTAEPQPERPGTGVHSDVNYFGLASLLISQHGAQANTEAIRLMQEAMQEADSLAVSDWHAVSQAIALLSNDSAATRH
jgi:hypothetical protein